MSTTFKVLFLLLGCFFSSFLTAVVPPSEQTELENELHFLERELHDLKSKISQQKKEKSLRFNDYSAICNGRLTLSSGNPVSSSDVSGASTLYFTPYNGSMISLHEKGRWRLFYFTERSLALTGLTSGKNYDVFLYNNAGTLTLELSTAWTNDTTRADALATQNSIYVKNGLTSRRYIGTIRTTSTTTTEDSATKRFVWNQCGRIARPVQVTDATASWTQTGLGWAQANGSSSNQIQVVTGFAVEPVILYAGADFYQADTTNYTVATGIGEDTTTAASGGVPYSDSNTVTAKHTSVHGWLHKVSTQGYHYYQWMTYVGSGSANAYWYSSSVYSGMYGVVWN